MLPARLPYGLDCHLRLGQRARLVRADDGGRPQGLHGGEPLDQGVAAGHPPHRHRQRNRHRGRQPLRHERDHDYQGEHRRPGHLVASQSADSEQAQARRDRDRGYPPGHHRHLTLQRTVLARHLGRQAVDPAELRSQPGREHHGPAAAVDHRRAHEHAVARVGGLGLRHRITDPRCRAALTGQGRHLYQQVMRVNQPAIRRDRIPRIRHHQVTGNQVNGWDLRQLTIRITRAVAGTSACSASAVRSAACSCANPITALSSTTPRIPIASTRLADSLGVLRA